MQNGRKVLHGTLAQIRESAPDLREKGLEEIFLRATGYENDAGATRETQP